MTAAEIQYALTYSSNSPFYARSHIVVPNVYWGLDFEHEIDLLVVSQPAATGTEVEIKISKGDLKRDFKKKHGHRDERIWRLFYAGPFELKDAFFELVPPECGIITVQKWPNGEGSRPKYDVSVRRNAKMSYSGKKVFTDKEIFKLMRLAYFRYWSMFARQFRGP
jgi:hypothetical protein